MWLIKANGKRKKPPRSPAAAFLIGGGQLREVCWSWWGVLSLAGLAV